MIATGWAVRSGKVWTTDARHRETKAQLNKWTREAVLAVEMQAASLFAFGAAGQASVASVAVVSNSVDHARAQFIGNAERVASQDLSRKIEAQLESEPEMESASVKTA